MATPAATTEAEQLRTALAAHTGSQHLFRHWMRRFVYTEGVQHLGEEAGAYWLIDLIGTHCHHPMLRTEEFQVWTLTVHENRSATLLVTDGNDNLLIQRGIHWTDFPLDEITLYLTARTLLLPSEY